MRHGSRLILVLALAILMLPALGGIAFASHLLTVGDENVDVFDDQVENCNGIIPTPGSENTVKRLVGGTLEAGGTAEYEISYPVDADDVGDAFEIVDCMLVGTGDNLKTYDVLDVARFEGVVNSTSFELNFTIELPENLSPGTTVCNVAKTTEGPTAPQSSNRKAGPACFTLGGGARVEKYAEGDDDNLLAGATFNVSDCNNTSETPELQPIEISPEPDGDGDVLADEGWISFSGAAGSTCVVTEVEAPEGYDLPADPDDRSITVEMAGFNEDINVYEFFDPAEEPDEPVVNSARAAVSAGECDFDDGESVTRISVNVTGDASVTLTDEDGDTVKKFDKDGSVDVGPGTYEWAAAAGDGSELEGDDGGDITADSCPVEVLGEDLAKTGSVLIDWAAVGLAFVAMGGALMTTVRRRELELSRGARRSDG